MNIRQYIGGLWVLLLCLPIAAQIPISTLEELDAIRNDLSGDYILVNDIDASPTALASYNNGQGWEPIEGVYGGSFRGTFDGNGHTIDNLFIFKEQRYSAFTGLFAVIDYNGAVQDLHLRNVNIIGEDSTGGLAGNIRGRVNRCSVTGKISGCLAVGGLSGTCVGVISDSFAIVEIIGDYKVGGLTGYFFGSVDSCYSSGVVKGLSQVGGLVGDNQGDVSNSYSNSDVFGFGYGASLVSINSGNIRNSYSIGSVETDFTILDSLFSRKCITTINVNTDYQFGGLVGIETEGFGNTISSHWDIISSELINSDGGTSRTTEQMIFPVGKETYVGWDFTVVWNAGDESYHNNGYPYHWWQKTRYTLQYMSDANGTLQGPTTQTRIPGASSAAMTAVPNSGYTFGKWSDGVLQNPRIDKAITSDINVTAIFLPIQDSLISR